MTRRVLQVVGPSAGGVARHVADVVAGLDGRDGIEVDVAGPHGLPIEMPKPMHLVDIPKGAFSGHAVAIRRLRELASRYQVVHAHGLRAGIDSGIAARGARSYATVHNLVRTEISGWRSVFHRRAETLVVGFNDRVFAVSGDIARRLRRAALFGRSKIEVLYLGIGPPPQPGRGRDEVRTELGLAPGAALVVSLARLVPQKALHVLIGALAQIPRAHLAILGEGPQRGALEAAARQAGVTDRVTFLGFRSDAADFVAAADVFGLSSVWEGIPLAAQEAIALGIPVVATDVGGMKELISNKLSGRLVPPGDPVQLGSALAQVLASPEDRQRYVRHAQADLAARFSRERTLERLREAYAD